MMFMYRNMVDLDLDSIQYIATARKLLLSLTTLCQMQNLWQKILFNRYQIQICDPNAPQTQSKEQFKQKYEVIFGYISLFNV